ncbi:centromere-associated protein E isoform X2 [Syngnathus scovelli]|uniref:centromere-associated protein E isoform X2 n=1 Tax=Syngnathus scovelli TaxID=161590 RepID=UPI002110AEDD|nr:centromere-associated protein E isoform X2 [Syngnathus scovelli]
MAEESAVKVCVRVRPIIKREEGVPSEQAAPVQVFWKTDKKSIHQIDDGSSTKSFSFDRVFTPEETTNQLYQEIAKPLVVSTVQGYNGTIFAYGQTSSGKTFTMMGSDHVPGVIPLAIDGVFETIKKCPEKEFLLRVSYMEIYNETVTDLLVDSWKRKPLEVRESLNKTIYVADLTEELVTSSAQALAWIRKGEKNRHYGKTEMNERSSRSHTVFRMILESRERSDLGPGENADGAIIVSHLNLVDLAGSERASQTGAEGTRLKEGCNINRSLFTLGQVIKKLSEESQSVSRSFINYRDSKLTRILQNSLGGNAKTVILCTITTATLDETLRTLQFASTAKKMKNDPHVTEVSDDGALLRRYRTEIVDLKRRLHEVSSITQTTATEKEVLSQLLQEKHQLQVEQEDRIRNLTKLLVTSNNLTCVQKVPKRRVTWGGKMLRLAHPSPSEDCLSDRSFAASVSRKRKVHSSSVMEQIEDEDFDGDWEIPDESSDDTSQCQDFVTFRSMASRAAERVAELEVELQTVGQQNQQARDQIVAMEQKAAQVDLKLQSEMQEKSQAVDKVQLLELRVTDLKLQLEEQLLNSGQQLEDDQRYEILATEMDMLASERDYLKQALDLARERTQILETEKTALSQELEEKTELQEFISLEEKMRNEQECELKNKISSLKEAMESRELQYLELQTNLETVSEELRKKTKIADDLQNMCGKDLSKEVAKLQLSLEDSEALGRETKKEWAVLRSENIALQELKITLTDSHEKMEAEVNSLRLQLEAEKSQFKKMQADLQKELNLVFNENTKLTSLLDGKVPKNMMESVELERTVTELKKELAASQEAEGVLRAQVEELQSLQAPTFEADNPEKPISSQELEELESVVATLRAERDQLQMDLQENIDMMIELQEELRTELGEKVVLKERIKQLEESQTDNFEKPSDDLTAELETLQAQKEQLEATLQVVNQQKDKLEGELQHFIDGAAENQSLLHSLQSQLQEQVERNDDIEQSAGEKQAQLQQQVEESQTLLQSLQDELEELKHKNNNLVKITEEKEFDLKQSIKILSQELETANANGGDLNEDTGRQTLTEETRELLSRVTSLTEERDQLLETVKHLRQDKMQLRTELEENMEMMQCGLQQQIESDLPLLKELEGQQNAQTAETQAELTIAEEKIRLLQEEINLLMNENKCQELQNQVQRLSEELERATAERSSLQSEMEKLLCQVTSLGEERHQLHEQLEALGQETSQLRAQLETRALTDKSECDEAEKNAQQAEELENLTRKVAALAEERAQLQETVEMLTQEKNQLTVKLEEVTEAEKMHLIARVEAEQAALLVEHQSSTEDLDNLNFTVMSLSEERAQLQETLELLRRDKNEILAKLEDVVETYQEEKMHLTEKLRGVETERDVLLDEKERQLQSATDELEKLNCGVTSLSEERAQLQEMLEILRQDKNELTAKLERVTETFQTEKMYLIEKVKGMEDELESRHQSSSEELKKLDCRVKSLDEERAQLRETLEEVEREKKQLETELQDKVSTMQESENKHKESRLLQQAEARKLESDLRQEVQQLEEQLKSIKENQTAVQIEATTSQQLLAEANATVAVLNEKLKCCEQDLTASKVTGQSRLRDLTLQLEELFGRLEEFIHKTGQLQPAFEGDSLKAELFVTNEEYNSFPQATRKVANVVYRLGAQNLSTLQIMLDALQVEAKEFKRIFRESIQIDATIFEEWHLQDVLRCKADSPPDLDYSSEQTHRLAELIDKRQFYVQKVGHILETLDAALDSYHNEVSAEDKERARFSGLVQEEHARQPLDASRMHGLFSAEAASRSAVLQNRKMLLQSIFTERDVQYQELQQVTARAQSQLQEEKSKRVSLRQKLEENPERPELTLLGNNQEFTSLLQQSEEKVKALCLKNKELEETQQKNNTCISGYKKTIQQLETELMENRVKAEELKNDVKILKSQLHESEERASPSVAELQKAQAQLYMKTMELSVASDKHQQEIQRMTAALQMKEESVRKLKESLRVVQQQGADPFLKGEELCDRFMNPRGVVIKSSAMLQNSKLEEEVKQLQVKIAQLESVISSQQADLSKWKNRALKIKSMVKADIKPSPPCTPTKRGLPMCPDLLPQSPKKLLLTSHKVPDSPVRQLDAPRIPLLNSPKSRFFDEGANTDLLSRTFPRKFFDNSSLGLSADATSDGCASQSSDVPDCVTQ